MMMSAQNRLETMPEEELWREYRNDGNPDIRNFLVTQYAPLVKYVAGKISVGLPNHVEYDDLVGYGVFGLFDAIEKYDPDKHVKFKTYAVTRIRGAIFDELRSIDWVPRSVRQKSRELEESVRKLESSLGRTASDKEVAADMGVTMKELDKTLMKISATSLLSLNDVRYSGDDNMGVSIGDTISSSQVSHPDVVVEKEEMRSVIVAAIQQLPDNEKKVLILYYFEDLTLKEIGEVLEVTESRISQLHTKAIIRLRAKLTNSKKGIL